MSVAAIGELNGDYFVTVSFCGMNTRTEEKLRGKAMKLPEHYEKWVEDQAFASHPFPTKSEWIEQRGDTLMTYEVGSYVEEAFESGARAMYRKLMEDFAPAIEALKFYADRRNWDKTIIANGSTITTSEWADRLIVTDCALLNCGGGRARLARDYLKEKGLVER